MLLNEFVRGIFVKLSSMINGGGGGGGGIDVSVICNVGAKRIIYYLLVINLSYIFEQSSRHYLMIYQE